jgi:hypothetical protein
MPDQNINIEVADSLTEFDSRRSSQQRHSGTIEILEAVLLAFVAVVTALSGYQAARWDGESAKAYATSTRLRVESQEAQLTSNQTLLYNSGELDSWLQAVTRGQTRLATLLAHRFTAPYAVAFRAWLRTHPLTNAAAPAGPRFMPQYRDPLAARAGTLSDEATAAFNEGVDDRATAEGYVRVTVILAAVLFIIAIGQRFDLRRVRVGLSVVAGALLVYCFVLLIIYPHA